MEELEPKSRESREGVPARTGVCQCMNVVPHHLPLSVGENDCSCWIKKFTFFFQKKVCKQHDQHYGGIISKQTVTIVC